MKDGYYDFWKNRVVHSTISWSFLLHKNLFILKSVRYRSAIKTFKYRQALSKLCLSSHSLKYKQPKIPRERKNLFSL